MEKNFNHFKVKKEILNDTNVCIECRFVYIQIISKLDCRGCESSRRRWFMREYVEK